MLAQQLDRTSQAAFLISAKVVVNMPAQIIIAKIVIIIGARPNDVVERIHSEIAGFAQLAAQSGIFDTAPQRPDGVNKGQRGHFVPCSAEIPDVVVPWGAQEVQRWITDQ